MKILGHPLHMILVHFPSGLLPIEFLYFGFGMYTSNQSVLLASYYLLLPGVVLGWVAIIAGGLDTAKLVSTSTNATQKAILHGSINTAVIIFYSIVLFRAYNRLPKVDTSWVLLIGKGMAVSTLMIGNYFGGSLVLKDKIGVEKS